MPNDFYTNTSTAVDDTGADAADVNSQFIAIENAFSAVEVQTDASVRGPDGETLSRLGAAATRFNTVMLFNGSGQPVASSAMLGDFSMGGHKLTNLADPVAAGDAVSFGYLGTYSGLLAGIPALPGSAGKSLMSDGAMVLWDYPFPAPAGERQMLLSTGAEVRSWGDNGINLLPNPTGEFGVTFWSGAPLSAEYDPSRGVYVFAVANGTAKATSNTGVIFVSSGFVYSLSSEAIGTTSGGTVEMIVEHRKADNTLLQTDSQALSFVAPSFTSNAMTGVAVANTAYLCAGIKTTSLTGSTVKVRRLKLEAGATPTPFTDDATLRALWLEYNATGKIGDASATATLEIGGATTTSAQADLHSAGGAGSDYDIRLESVGGTVGSPGKGIAKLTTVGFKVTGAIGYSAAVALGNLGATETIDWASGAYQTGTLDQACTITVNSPGASYPLGMYRIYLTQGGAGNFLATWAGTTITWAGGIAPPAAVTGKVTVVYLDWNGTKFYGSWTEF